MSSLRKELDEKYKNHKYIIYDFEKLLIPEGVHKEIVKGFYSYLVLESYRHEIFDEEYSTRNPCVYCINIDNNPRVYSIEMNDFKLIRLVHYDDIKEIIDRIDRQNEISEQIKSQTISYNLNNKKDDLLNEKYNNIKDNILKETSGILNSLFYQMLEETKKTIDVNFLNLFNNIILEKVRDRELHVLTSMTYLFEAKDQYTPGHQERVQKLSVAIAEEIYKNRENFDHIIYIIKIASLLHDIGKIAIPMEIINKKGLLTDEEFDQIKRHPEIGYNYLKKYDFFGEYTPLIAEIVYKHHQNFDGTGYPERSADEDICLEASILRVADSFEAMENARSYIEARGTDYALNELKKFRGSSYHPLVVDVCCDLVENRGFRF